jgi:AcrR family transcriptional regulator
MDIRIEATQRELKKAILSLAAQKDVGAITVAELACAAGIDRSTFYAHASSPADLLLGVLLEDLDPIRLEVLDHSPKAFAEAGRQLSRQLVEHIERYAAIYGERDSTRPNSALHTVLSTRFRESLELIFEHFKGARGTDSALEPRYLAAFIAHGIVGLVATWLNEPAPRNRAKLEAMFGVVYSTWVAPGRRPQQRRRPTALAKRR